MLSIITALEYRSQHPLASAVINKAEHENISYSNVSVKDFSSITGQGNPRKNRWDLLLYWQLQTIFRFTGNSFDRYNQRFNLFPPTAGQNCDDGRNRK